mmetsp:Transcript_2633/g.3824  ORF Transcript_2633/g.3824 Transcript_2633/m.3824 type:complete len:330 (+) Transcript_2633:54-1043(+)
MGLNVLPENGDDHPRMCYNGPQNWQMGWYADKDFTVDLYAGDWTGELVGFVDYDDIGENQFITIRLDAERATDDYYIHFNRKASINDGVVEGGDQVLVTSRWSFTPPDYYSETTLHAKLNEDDSFVIVDFGLGIDINIKVDKIDLDAIPAFARISITSDTMDKTKPPKSAPLDCPHDDPCNAEDIFLDGIGVVVNNEGCTAESPTDVPTFEGDFGRSTWLRFTAPITGCIQISYEYISGFQDAVMRLYETDGCDAYPFKLLEFNDDSPYNLDPLVKIDDRSLRPGREYYVAVDAWFTGETIMGSVNITDPCRRCGLLCQMLDARDMFGS